MFHGGVEACKYKLKAKKFFREPVMHQIYKGVCINRSASKTGFLMNSKAEYHQAGAGVSASDRPRSQGLLKQEDPNRYFTLPNPNYSFVCWGLLLYLLGRGFVVIDHRFMFMHLMRSR